MATAIINGTEVEAPQNAVAYKFADPIEGAKWVYYEGDAQDIIEEDHNLIVWVNDDR